MKHKYQQQKGLVRLGIVAALAVAFLALAGGLAQNSAVYAAEDEAEDAVAYAAEDVAEDEATTQATAGPAPAFPEEEDLTEEKARQAAERLVTTVKRLEATPKYQEVAGLLRAYHCRYYDDAQPSNYYGCDKKTDSEDVRRELANFVPEDKRAEIPENVVWQAIEEFVPYSGEWSSVYIGVKEVYGALHDWQGVDGSGITAELTVDNVTKAMLKAKSTLGLRSGSSLMPFWYALLVLQADTPAARIARLNSQLQSANWMRLVELTYLATHNPYYQSELAIKLAYYVGTKAYSATLEEKLALARGLSDWGQAKTLFDAINTACGKLNEEGYYIYNSASYCYSALLKLDNGTLNELYAKAENAAAILYPDEMKTMWDYRLVLAELPEAQKAPNSGILGDYEGDTNDLAAVVTVALGGIAIIGGVLTVVRLWTRKKF